MWCIPKLCDAAFVCQMEQVLDVYEQPYNPEYPLVCTDKTKLGAEHVGLIQSLIATCRLHDINPYTYLVDVLQRVSIHPACRVAELTPRWWKVYFADNPLRSDIYDFG